MTDRELKALLQDMSLQEKIGQMLQLMTFFYQENAEGVLTGPAKELGLSLEHIKLAGSVLGSMGAKQLMEIQTEYQKNQPHHIPMLFMLDVIHGLKTIFPIPLAFGATFQPELAEECFTVIAKEASAAGIHVTFAPMVDLVRDARWGRVMESTGEDPYLNSLFAKAMVRGIQGEYLGEKDRLCACVKHFAGYGAPMAGRDYNTVELSEHTLRQYYLPAYHAGIRAGAGMVMTSFNTINGIPATANRWLMRDILRKEMGFDGVLISDYAAIAECIAHGYAEHEETAAKSAVEAGVDIDMMTGMYACNLENLVTKGEIPEELIDESVWRILKLKNTLGLFENPYKDADEEKEKQLLLCKEHRDLARNAACQSFVLLKNNGILPLKPDQSIAFIGPYITDRSFLSTWAITGDKKDCMSLQEAAEEVFDPEKLSFCEGSQILGNEVHLTGFEGANQEEEAEKTQEELDRLLWQAKENARKAQLVVLAIGEHILQSGEATSRAMIEIPAVQMQLYREIKKVNSNIVVVLFNGRPLDLREISEGASAILEVWRPGTEGAHAIMDTLTGKNNPSGKLPMSMPYCVGQVPVYYNEYRTGRPYEEGSENRFCSRYTDIPNAPLYAFGYGLSYTSFDISPVRLSSTSLHEKEAITAAVTVKNSGQRAGVCTVQLYIRDVAASVVRPGKELKGFRRISLEAGEQADVSFEISEEMLRFYRADGTWGSEPGGFHLWIGEDSTTKNKAEFQLG